MILVVDDEQIQCQFVADAVKRLRPKEIVLKAYSGLEALELVRNNPVTSIITDIEMLEGNGLDFARECKQINNKIKIVILSAYPNFEYAQEAIRVGALDYVVKPLNNEKMKGILEKIEGRDDDQETENDNVLRYEREKAFRVYCSDYFRNILLGDIPQNQSLLRNILKDSTHCIVCVWKPENLNDALENIENKVSEVCHEFLGKCILIPMRKDNKEEYHLTVLVTGCRNCETEERLSFKMKNALSRINQITGICWSASVTEVKEFEENIPGKLINAYRFVKGEIDRVFFDGFGYCYLEDNKTAKTKVAYDYDKVKELLDTILAEKADMANELLQEIFAALDQTLCSSKEYKQYICNIFTDMFKQKRMNFLQNEIGKWIHQMNTEWMVCFTREKFQKMVFSFLDHLMRSISERDDEKKLNDCLKYIQEHYNEDLSRDEIAQKFHIKPNYFSVLFKNQFGMTFSEYLLQIRMEQAAQLLKNGYDNVEIVAKKVGYSDVKYFSRVFKKYYTYTPSMYRNRRNETDEGY